METKDLTHNLHCLLHASEEAFLKDPNFVYYFEINEETLSQFKINFQVKIFDFSVWKSSSEEIKIDVLDAWVVTSLTEWDQGLFALRLAIGSKCIGALVRTPVLSIGKLTNEIRTINHPSPILFFNNISLPKGKATLRRIERSNLF